MKRIGLHIALMGMLLCIGGIAFANDNEKTYIVLPEKHIVQFATQTVVRLGDLATAIKTPDESLLPGLKAVKLMDAPKVGEKARIGHALIMQQIRSAGFDFFNTKLVGANLTFVYGAGQKITVESLVKAIQQHVKKETDWSNDELVLRILSTPTKDCWLPPGEYEMEIDCMNPRTLGTARYEIRFFQNKILVDKAPFVVSISHQRSIFVPNRNIRRGEIVTQDDLREIQQLIQNDMLDRQIIASQKEIVGRKCRTPLKKGDPIKYYALETNYLTKRGDLVYMIVKNRGMTLQTVAFAQTRGGKGDVIPVKTKATGKIVKAKILARGWVQLVSS